MKQGFTLVEVIIAAVIFSIMFGGVIGVLIIGQEAFNQGVMTVSMESDATRIIDRLTMYLPECKIEIPPSSGNNHTSMTIQIPVEVDGEYWHIDGDSVVINWGADGNQGWTYTYQFVTGTTADEEADGKDYNGDGDMLDIFYIGKIQIIIKDAGEVTQQTVDIGSNVLLSGETMDEDIDGDGSPDPLFLMLNSLGGEDIINGNRIRVNLSLVKMDARGANAFANAKTERTLINPQ